MSIMLELTIVFGAIALASAAVLLVIRDLVTQRWIAIEQRLSGGQREISAEELLVTTYAPRTGPVGSFDDWFDRFILETGMQWTSAAAFLAMVAAGIGLGGALFLWRENLLVAGVGMLAGILLAGAVFAFIRRRRMQQFDEQLPSVLELIARAVRAGETLDQAVELVARTALEPSASELRYCVRQMQLGLSVDSTFRALAQRIPLPELRLFAAALIVQRRAGGSLAITLERFAKAIRERQAYRRQLRVATAAGRWSAAIIVLLSIGLLVYLFGWRYDYIHSFFDSSLGQMIFMLAVGLEIIGVVWVIALTRSEV